MLLVGVVLLIVYQIGVLLVTLTAALYKAAHM